MAGTDGWSRILHRTDDRGVIVESRVFGPDDEIPDGFDTGEYQPVHPPREDDAEPVAESVLTPWESPVAKGTWVENRPEDDEVSEGTPIQARFEDELTDAEREALEQATGDESVSVVEQVEELSDGTPREAREQSEDGDLTGAEEEVDKTLDEEPPPQGGPGSGKDAWAQYAAAKGVAVPDGATRDDIVAAVEKAGHPV